VQSVKPFLLLLPHTPLDNAAAARTAAAGGKSRLAAAAAVAAAECGVRQAGWGLQIRTHKYFLSPSSQIHV